MSGRVPKLAEGENGFREKMTGLADNNSIDPFKLIPGEYVVHRASLVLDAFYVRTISADEPTNGAGSSVETSRIGYLFIEYADGTAQGARQSSMSTL